MLSGAANIYNEILWKNTNVNLNTLTILAKSCIWDFWLGQECASPGGFNIAFKIQAEMSKHKSTIKTIKSICVVSLSRIFFRKLLCKLLSKHLWRSLYLVKFMVSAYSSEHLSADASEVWELFFETNYFRHLNIIHTAKALLQKWKLQDLFR